MTFQKFFILIFCLAFSNFACSQNEYPQDSVSAAQPLLTDSATNTVKKDSVLTSTTTSLKDTLHIIGVGDMMFGTNYPSTAHLPANEAKNLLADVATILQGADLTFGNLEGVVLNEGGKVKRCSDPSKCYAFRMPEKYAQNALEMGGFDVVSIANNHVGDFGNTGRQNTMRFLKELKIETAGLVSCPSTIFEKGGIKYGFAAFAPNSGTMDIRNIPAAKKIVQMLADSCDIVIVSFHGGAEGSNKQHVTRQTETFYGENRGNVYQFAHAMIDAGADIVFGHGPHVTRAMEVYKERFIAYSLGNFCTYDRFNIRGVSGLAPLVDIKTDRRGKFLSGQITPIIQIERGVVKIDEQKRVISVIQNLNKTDIPENPIIVTDEGKIIWK